MTLSCRADMCNQVSMWLWWGNNSSDRLYRLSTHLLRRLQSGGSTVSIVRQLRQGNVYFLGHWDPSTLQTFLLCTPNCCCQSSFACNNTQDRSAIEYRSCVYNTRSNVCVMTVQRIIVNHRLYRIQDQSVSAPSMYDICKCR